MRIAALGFWGFGWLALWYFVRSAIMFEFAGLAVDMSIVDIGE